MVQIKDRYGTAHSAEAYVASLVPPPEAERAIHTALQGLEGNLIGIHPSVTLAPRDYNHQLKYAAEDLLKVASYSRNILLQPYIPSPDAVRKLKEYTTWLKKRRLPSHGFEYYFAKARSVGIDVDLTHRQKEKLQMEFEEAGDFKKIKMLSRGNILGIEYSLSPERAQQLTDFTNNYTQGRINLQGRIEKIAQQTDKNLEQQRIARVLDFYDLALIAAATRSGLNVEVSKEAVDFYLQFLREPALFCWVWQIKTRFRDVSEEEMNEYKRRMQEGKQFEDDFFFNSYLHIIHHLKDIVWG